MISKLAYWYAQYYLRKAMKARKNGNNGELRSTAIEFRKYYLK